MPLIILSTFIGSFLLFMVQPFAARLFLPLSGGSPALWNTCMLFFQLLLLTGYGLTHFLTSRFSMRRQLMLFFVCVCLPLFFLPPDVPDVGPPAGENMNLWLLRFLWSTVGAAFLVMSMTAPLIQKWLSNTTIDGAKDPYFLYAASNFGSLLGLLAYPFLVEPFFALSQQSRWFSGLYLVFAGLSMIAGLYCLKNASNEKNVFTASTVEKDTAESGDGIADEDKTLSLNVIRDANEAGNDRDVCHNCDDAEGNVESITPATALRWMLLAFLPSSLSLGVTHHLSTEIAPLPMLWAVPLSLYLLTYIIAFSGRGKFLIEKAAGCYRVIVLMLLFAFLRQANDPILIIVGIHLSALFCGALVCHGLLAESRPPAKHLTLFYLVLAIGGALGGIFNAIVAPMIFSSILEYPIILAAIAFLIKAGPSPSPQSEEKAGPFVRLAGLWWFTPVLLGCWLLLVHSLLGPRDSYDIAQLMLRDVVTPLLVFFLAFRGKSLAISVLIVLLSASLFPASLGRTLHTERTFFGVHRVTRSFDGQFNQLIHGTTIHGVQSLASFENPQPSSYFHPSGPLGETFAAIRSRQAPGGNSLNIGIIGLGAGAIAAYTKPEDDLTFFEIDPSVISIARDTRYFTFLARAQAPLKIVEGDGRQSLEKTASASFDLLILDAFSADSVPMHLLTLEAFKLYISRLTSNGVMAFHISNRYLSMNQVIAATLHDAGFTAYIMEDQTVTDEQFAQGKTISTWLVSAHRPELLGDLTRDLRWQKIKVTPDSRRWTDERASLLDMLIFR